MCQNANRGTDRGGGTGIVGGSTYFLNLRRKMRATVPPSAVRALEAGSGESDYDRIAREARNYRIREIEQSLNEAESAERVLARATCSGLTDAVDHLPLASFDFIVPSDVPEYLKEEAAGLRAAIRRLVAHGGFVVSRAILRFIGKCCHVLLNRHWRHPGVGILDRTNFPCLSEQYDRQSIEENEYEVLRLQGTYPTRRSHFSRIHALALGTIAGARLLGLARVILPRRAD